MKKRYLFIILLPFFLHFFITFVHASKNDPADDEHDEDHKESKVNLGNDVNAENVKGKGSEGRISKGDPFDKFNSSANSVAGEDEAAFLRIKSDKKEHGGGCMKIPHDNYETHIPSQLIGKKNFGEKCDPNPGANQNDACKQFVEVEYADAKNKWKSCLKPTHFICDPVTKKCACGQDSNVISPIRFQIGNEKSGKHRTKGICYIRPTFDYIEGFECAPGTEKTTVILDEDENPKPVPICSCPKVEGEQEKFSSQDNNWWTCERGCSIEVAKLLIIFSLILTLKHLTS